MHWHYLPGTSNTNLGATEYEFGGMYFAFFTVNTAKYSPKYFRICKYGPYLAFLPVVSDGTCEAACTCRITRVRHSSANSEVVSGTVWAIPLFFPRSVRTPEAGGPRAPGVGPIGLRVGGLVLCSEIALQKRALWIIFFCLGVSSSARAQFHHLPLDDRPSGQIGLVYCAVSL